MDNTNMEYKKEKRGYSKRSMWSWIGMYLVAAIIVYSGAFLIYREVKDNGADDSGNNIVQSTSIY